MNNIIHFHINTAVDNKIFIEPFTDEQNKTIEYIIIESNKFHENFPYNKTWAFNIGGMVIHCMYNSKIYMNNKYFKNHTNIINLTIEDDLVELSFSDFYIKKILRKRKIGEIFGA